MSVQPYRTPSGYGPRRRTLLGAGLAHALHDGYTDALYVLLPVWQAQFGLSYAAIGLLRAVYPGVMAVFQVMAGPAASRLTRKALLVGGTLVAALGYFMAGFAGTVLGIAVALAVCGLGSSAQHPLASALVADAHRGSASRPALGTYNFSGDLGKMAMPALVAALLATGPWQSAVIVVGTLGIVTAALLGILIPSSADPPTHPEEAALHDSGGDGERDWTGFGALASIGVIDTATRMGFLTFLPFLLQAKEARVADIGLALSLVFAGGAAGKLACGFLGARLGVLWTVWITEGLTAIGIAALIVAPLAACFVLLPLVGMALNGTSSVLYGSVPEVSPADRRDFAFSLFYTGTIGSGAIAPFLYGAIGDRFSVPSMLYLVAATALLTLPLAWKANRALERRTRARSRRTQAPAA
jgi:MFS transporter, FSR family, fosmidomycin resistance protein